MTLLLDAHLSAIMISNQLAPLLESIEAKISAYIDFNNQCEKKLRGYLMPFALSKQMDVEGFKKETRSTNGKKKKSQWEKMMENVNEGVGDYFIEKFPFLL